MDPDEPDLDELLERAARYAEATLLGKAALQLTQRALDAREREVLRRHSIGAEGRIAEDAVRAIVESDELWALLAARDVPENVSNREFDEIHRYLVGRPLGPADPLPMISITSARDVLRLEVVTSLLPDLPSRVDGYRYAALPGPGLEPFLVLLRSRAAGGNTVVATVHLGATFLRHEQQFGVMDPDRVQTLATLVAADLENVRRTHRELREP